MSTTTDTGSQEYFSCAAAWDTLARSAKQHDQQACCNAASFLDTRPITVLRGLAFMMQQVASIPEDDVICSETQDAIQSAAEVVALVAVMLEHQNDAAIYRMISAMK